MALGRSVMGCGSWWGVQQRGEFGDLGIWAEVLKLLLGGLHVEVCRSSA